MSLEVCELELLLTNIMQQHKVGLNFVSQKLLAEKVESATEGLTVEARKSMAVLSG